MGTSTPPPHEVDNLLTTSQASAEYGIPARTLQGAARRGVISSRRVGKTFLLDRASVAIYARTHTSRGRYARKDIA
ncbi:helix-turn-helix domain-containing protein [Streptomyces massasporeus]|uniref:helix-turn-helix domain-containing protein n=1 Tax=Streptomyces massasporeus TaxID=67324 RepID=UPI00366A218D